MDDFLAQNWGAIVGIVGSGGIGGLFLLMVKILREVRGAHNEATTEIAKGVVGTALDARWSKERDESAKMSKGIASTVVHSILEDHCIKQRSSCIDEFHRVHGRLDNITEKIGGLTEAVKKNNHNGEIERIEQKVDALAKQIMGG
ncbi:MAG: hypothetical protein M0Q12_00035 [Synergistaceae bacterium]|jgi:hypothetical protein|nr:hypothetical protein [Synergistaceae bacterium]